MAVHRAHQQAGINHAHAGQSAEAGQWLDTTGCAIQLGLTPCIVTHIHHPDDTVPAPHDHVLRVITVDVRDSDARRCYILVDA